MANYKNYVVHSSETLSEIAYRELGHESAVKDLVSINRLRYPYISDNPRHQFGKELASFSLLEPANSGSSNIKIPRSYIINDAIRESFLYPGNYVYFSSFADNGDVIHDAMEIERYYPYEEIADGSLLIPEGTLEFATEKIAAPQFSMNQSGLVFISKPTLSTWPSTYYLDTQVGSSGLVELLPTVAGYYYFAYTFVAENGKETPCSPFQSFFEASTGKYKPEYLHITSQNILDGYRIVIKSPSSFPGGVKSIRAYAAYSDPNISSAETPPNLTFKKEFFAANEFLVVSSVSAGQSPPITNFAKTGLNFSYKVGSKISFFEPPNTLPSSVLKTGDILRIPVTSSDSYGLINTFSSESFLNPFGTDIALDEYGYISFTGNYSRDILTVTGRKNVLQALNNRLKTYVGQMSLQPEFGNLALGRIGSSFSISILSTVEAMCVNCVLSDPRVSSVKSIEVSFDTKNSAISVGNFSIELKTVGSVINLSPFAINI